MDKIHPILKSYIPVVEAIGNSFGKNCEVVLHDVTNVDKSIIAIVNGHVTKRTVGCPMSEYGLKTLRKGQYDKNIINYKKKTADGRILKSTSMFIKDERGELLGLLCINYDISEFLIVKGMLQELTSVADDAELIEDDTTSEFENINEVLNSIVERTIEAFGKPVAYITKEEKVSIVETLNEKGVFMIKGAIDHVAKVLCVSRYTIYNYLDEIRINEKE